MSSFFKKVWGTSSASADKRGGRKSASTSMTIESIEALTQKEEHLEKRRMLIEQRIAKELESARNYNKQNKKSQAIMCLKKKKMYEKNMEDLGNLIMKVNEQKMVLENAQTMAETLKALGNATKASKSALKDNQIEDVDKLMDDIAAETDAMREINDRISEPASFMAEYDDDELLADLNDMDAEMLDEQLLAPNALPTVPDEMEELPSVPEKTVQPGQAAKPQTSEEQELAALAAELA